MRAFTGRLPGLYPDRCDMEEGATHLEDVGSAVEALRELDLEPVLVGSMALVVLGSRRVTRDFDFVVAQPGDTLGGLLGVFYNRGFELASRVNTERDVTATIDNPRVAATRLRLDAPASAYFLNPETGLRVDLLFDFPLPAATLARRADTVKVRSRVWQVASVTDLPAPEEDRARAEAGWRGLKKAGIEIAFSQLDVHLHRSSPRGGSETASLYRHHPLRQGVWMRAAPPGHTRRKCFGLSVTGASAFALAAARAISASYTAPPATPRSPSPSITAPWSRVDSGTTRATEITFSRASWRARPGPMRGLKGRFESTAKVSASE